MKRKFINKIILGTMISTTLFTLVPVRASAEWVTDYQSNRYYIQDNKRMTGWKRIDGQLYYFDENGKMITGWIKAGSSWYFLQNDGTLKKGWINYNRNWYYADSNGVIQTGTINIAGKIYIFDDNGVMKTSNTLINGQFYTIGLNGEVVGMKVPTPDKEFDDSGNCLEVLKNTKNKMTSPIDSKFDEVIEDETESDDDPNEGRTFKVNFRDSNGAELKTKNVKNGKKVELYTPTKEGYVFANWNTKSNGSGKSYDDDDDIKVKEDITLYAEWAEDTAVYVDEIIIKGSSNVTINKTIQMTADISPSDASNTSVTWSVSSGTGKATIDSNGVLTGVSNGTVTVKATAKDGSGESGTKQVTVSATDVVIPVSQISVTSSTGKITANGGTLQMKATISPDDANDQGVTWSVENRTGSASIDSNGLVTAISDGTVTVKATAKDGSGKVGSTTITISGQLTKILVDSITVTGKNDSEVIATDGGTLQMSAGILPSTASNKAVTWSVEKVGDTGTEMTGNAKISTNGLLTALADGTVTVKATAKDGSGESGTKLITISEQSIKVTEITVSGDNITTNGGTTQMSAIIVPDIATEKAVTWSVENRTGSAKIDSDGVLTAISNGEVNVIATAKDGSKVVGSKTIELSNQSTIIPVSSITVSGANNKSSITTDDGTLQMIATVLPTTTTSQAVTWSVSSGTGTGTISEDGVLTAVTNGSVVVKATSVDYPKIIGTKTINFSGQSVKVETIAVSSTSGVSKIEVDGKLQMSATVLPTNATKKTVVWSVDSIAGSSGSATIISTTGVLTGTSPGKVNVIATAADGSLTYGSKEIEIIPQVKVTGITVKGYPITDGTAGTTETAEITDDKKTLQMNATIEPTEATNKAVTWSVQTVSNVGTGMTGNATIDSITGILTPVTNGTVKVIATAKDGSGEVGEKVITISGQIIKATSIKVAPLDGITKTITADKGTLQMQGTIMPIDATVKPTVIFSVEQAGDIGTTMTGKATIDNSTGLLTAVANGTVKVKATATTAEGTVITGSEIITISGQIVPVSKITVTAPSDSVAIGTSLQMTANILPTTATDKTVTWSIVNGTGSASIGSDGKLAGETVGTVTVKATANDGSGESGTTVITIK